MNLESSPAEDGVGLSESSNEQPQDFPEAVPAGSEVRDKNQELLDRAKFYLKRLAMLGIISLNAMTALDGEFRNKVVEYMYGDNPRVQRLERELREERSKEKPLSEKKIQDPVAAVGEEYVDKDGIRHLKQDFKTETGEIIKLKIAIDQRHLSSSGDAPISMNASISHHDGSQTMIAIESKGPTDRIADIGFTPELPPNMP